MESFGDPGKVNYHIDIAKRRLQTPTALQVSEDHFAGKMGTGAPDQAAKPFATRGQSFYKVTSNEP